MSAGVWRVYLCPVCEGWPLVVASEVRVLDQMELQGLESR